MEHPTKYLEVPADRMSDLEREPFGFSHALGNHPLFDLKRLGTLVAGMAPTDYFISVPAQKENEDFYAREAPQDLEGARVVEAIEESRYKLLIKRPENHDPEFRALLDGALEQVFELTGQRPDAVLRAESGIFVTGFEAVTPYHFDPEHAFFFQIQGSKTYHVLSPAEVAETEKERHYAGNVLDIGRAEMTSAHRERELVLALEPGKGLHQPANSPHWVQTHDAVSVSWAFGYETIATRRRGRVWGLNHYLRRAGRNPVPPGARPSLDRVKAPMMQCLLAGLSVARRVRG